MATIIWHDLDPSKRNATIQSKIKRYKKDCAAEITQKREQRAKYESLRPRERAAWTHAPKAADEVEIVAMFDDSIKTEREYYAHVRVQETVLSKVKSEFRLVYDPNQAGGTGPFDSLEEAEKWFYTQGR